MFTCVHIIVHNCCTFQRIVTDFMRYRSNYLLTCNTAQNSSDYFPPNLQIITKAHMLSTGGDGVLVPYQWYQLLHSQQPINTLERT